MTKKSGLGGALLIDGVVVSNDIGSIDGLGSPMQVLETTGIDKLAIERVGGVRDGFLNFTGFFNDATGRLHPTLKTLPTTSRIYTFAPTGLTLGNASVSLQGKQVNYDPTRETSGGLTFKADNPSDGYGVDHGKTFGSITHTSGTATASMDGGSAGTTTFGYQAWLHVVALTGTNVIVTLQQSTDDGVVDTFATLGAFTSATAVGAQRIAATGNVERYIRILTSGTFTSATFVVQFTRNESTVNF